MATRTTELEELDLVIVGGGVSGLCALRTILTLERTSISVVLLESQPSIGGTWANERLYTGLKTNNVLGNYEFSDFPMDPSEFDIAAGEHIPGNVVHDYLETFVDKFELRDFIRLNSKVQNVREHQTINQDNSTPVSSWILEVESLSDHSTSTLKAKKLIIATGQTSQPFFPDRLFPNQEDFERPVFHCVDLHKHEDELLAKQQDTEGKRITVFGGAKSAFDAAYSVAEVHDCPVDMIIRASGHGPVWMTPAHVTPLQRLLEKLVNTRLLTWFSPCIWGTSDGYSSLRYLLHSTWLGRKIVDAFWWILGNDVETLNKYDSHPETAKLKPWISPLWVSTGLSILNYKHDFFELVRSGKIRVHIADIEKLSAGTIHLSTGDAIRSDGIICCTGWRTTPNLEFQPESELARDLGMPTADDPLPANVVQKADTHILNQLPRLKSQPKFNAKYQALIAEDTKQGGAAEVPSHPLRLYRFMVPCTPHLASSRSIAFLGMATTVSTIICTQIQALWIAAYFYHKDSLPLPSDAEIQWSTALHTQFCKWRYGVGGHGNRRPDFVFDAVPYMDMLLGDLGLSNARKQTRWQEWCEAYGVGDYKSLVEEYAERLKGDKKNV